ncbi:MAG: histidine kinase N-terminal domain-containing protein [Acidimicrobiia bacterium]|nr:histidine kinase N-terminal domain-containing protein [Acidimicrobiia bacterium]
MASLPELARLRTDLDEAEVARLERLVAVVGLLADLCFSDLLLWAPDRDHAGRFVVLANVRPTTSQTIYRTDWAGQSFAEDDRPLVARTFAAGTILEGEIEHTVLTEHVRVLVHPGALRRAHHRRAEPRVGAARCGATPAAERIYVEVFNRFAGMIAAGVFPFVEERGEDEITPRVGDGVTLLDEAGRIEFSSPNAVSALLRVGVHGAMTGLRFGELGLDGSVVDRAMAGRRPVSVEFENGPDTTVVARCLPLIEQDRVTGAIVLTRDISELRSRDRLLKSKDAAIREIHHRVKNNLQTISSLLRLQGRRLGAPEAKSALEESVRRIRSIALVHETLSREAGDDVPFIEIVRPLVRMVEEGLSSPERPLDFKVVGDAGTLPAPIATPLAVVLTELLQNVVDHAYPEGAVDEGGQAVVELANDGSELVVRVVDDGVGLPRASTSVRRPASVSRSSGPW